MRYIKKINEINFPSPQQDDEEYQPKPEGSPSDISTIEIFNMVKDEPYYQRIMNTEKISNEETEEILENIVGICEKGTFEDFQLGTCLFSLLNKKHPYLKDDRTTDKQTDDPRHRGGKSNLYHRYLSKWHDVYKQQIVGEDSNDREKRIMEITDKIHGITRDEQGFINQINKKQNEEFILENDQPQQHYLDKFKSELKQYGWVEIVENSKPTRYLINDITNIKGGSGKLYIGLVTRPEKGEGTRKFNIEVFATNPITIVCHNNNMTENNKSWWNAMVSKIQAQLNSY